MNPYTPCFNFPVPKKNGNDSDTLIDDQISTVENYDSQGLLIFSSTLEEFYDERESARIYRDSIINTYNNDGLLVFTTNIDEQYWNRGVFEQIYITTDKNTYNDDGLLLSNIEILEVVDTESEDGAIDYRSTTTNTYEYDDDLLISIDTVEEIDEGGNGTYVYERTANTTNTYDLDGLQLSTLYEYRDRDGAIKERELTNNTYNDKGLLVFTTTFYGEVDWGAASRRESTTNVYNNDGILINTVYEEDEGANNIIDRRREVSDNYNEDGLLISTTTVKEYDSDEDGNVNGSEEIIKNYNDSGLLISTTTIEEYDYQGDGTFDSRRETVSTNTYNDEGLLVSTVDELDYDKDGIADSIGSVTNTYNDEGLLVSTVEESGNADGTINARYLTTNTYNDDGLLVSTLFSADGGVYRDEYAEFDGEIDYRNQTVYSQETNYVPTVVNSIADITEDEDAPDLTIDLSNVFEDADSDTIELSVCHNSNPELVTPVLNQSDLTLDFLEYQSGTAYITVLGTADEQPGVETFTVTVNPLTLELYRFNNTAFETGTYLFVGEEERNAIRVDPYLESTFELEGVTEDGTINSAFRASLVPGDDLIPIFRLRHSHQGGMYLFVGEEEYESIFATDSPQKDNWIAEGVDDEGNDLAEFYLYSSGSGLGKSFERYRNTQNGTYLYVTEEEGAAIKDNPNLAEVFVYEGGAFESIV